MGSKRKSDVEDEDYDEYSNYKYNDYKKRYPVDFINYSLDNEDKEEEEKLIELNLENLVDKTNKLINRKYTSFYDSSLNDFENIKFSCVKKLFNYFEKSVGEDITTIRNKITNKDAFKIN